MNDGTILRAARESAKGTALAASVIIGVCLTVCALNWKYLFNCFTGPVPFTSSLAADPGGHEFVTVEGVLMPTGMTQQMTLKLKGLKVTEYTSAEYKMVKTDGRFLIVSLPVGFAGNVVSGRLEPLPEGLSAALASSAAFYPWMLIEQRDYRAHPGLFLMIAAIVLPLAILLLAFGLWRLAKPETTGAIRGLMRFGSPQKVIADIEAEIAAQGGPKKGDPITFTPSWVVVWEPLLDLIPKGEVAGIGLERKVKTSGSESTAKRIVNIWVKSRYGPTEVGVKEADGLRIMEYVRQHLRQALVEQVTEFAKSWPAQFRADVRDDKRT